MTDLTAQGNEQVIAFETFGVSIAVSADPSAASALHGLAPVPSQPCDPATVGHRMRIWGTEDGRFSVRYELRDGEVTGERDYSAWLAGDADLDLAIGSLDAHIQSCIGLHAPNHTFINAGVVAYRDEAILLPGGSLTGKRTLVAELVKLGCTRYSDDYAVLDEEGLVHPYLRPALPKSLELGHMNGRSPEAATDALKPLSIGAIIQTIYWPGTEWNPSRLSQGEAVLALVSNAEAGSERPDKTFHTIMGSLASEPLALSGKRGEAEAMAAPMLARLDHELAEPAS